VDSTTKVPTALNPCYRLERLARRPINAGGSSVSLGRELLPLASALLTLS
jgi:hypothetical protein